MFIHRSFFPPLTCPHCSHHGADYEVTENGQHHEAKCATCKRHIKYLSKEDKYGTKEQQASIWGKTMGRCCLCGCKLDPYKKNGLTIEHIMPQFKGGGHETENLYLACKSCNSQKQDKTLAEYRAWMKQKQSTPTWVFYFEVLEYSTIGNTLKIVF
jgi:5-methylcytosine-specific restriction endonuclease McrA